MKKSPFRDPRPAVTHDDVMKKVEARIEAMRKAGVLLPTEEGVQLIEADEAFFDKTGGFAPVLPDTASQLS